MQTTTSSIVMVAAIAAASQVIADDGDPPPTSELRTRWAAEVDAASVLPEHPRPQMTRPGWVNLNGTWQYAIRLQPSSWPRDWDGEILVPFCVESALSGVGRTVGPERTLWYRRTFERPAVEQGSRLLLHFGGVDWRSTVFVNGNTVGVHEGGYDAFTIDITEAVRDGENELVVQVWDPTDAGYQPRGKQVREPHGIWYTPVTGIWQTVWLEPVPSRSIESLRITPAFDANSVTIGVETRGRVDGTELLLETSIGGVDHAITAPTGAPLVLRPEQPIPAWSPDRPTLHEMTVSLRDADGATIDRVSSYFGFRSIEIGPDARGVMRLLLNGEPLFQYGTLDQGWWPDGLYTAPTDEALRHDLEVTRQLGFNMVRKHVKIEPARWYHWCDRLGLLVWQDMPSGDASIHGDQPDIERTEQSAANFERELRAMIGGFYNNPSVVMWVPYNEGWGQWDTGRITELIKQEDPTRLVDSASGWTDRGVGDVHDVHRYPGPAMPPLESSRAAVLGEFGGLGLPIEGHLWQDDGNWGYRSYDSRAALTDAYVDLLRRLHRLIGDGLAAAVYTQTTDVEIEVNGVMTYDRAVTKLDVERAATAARRLHLPPPKISTVVPTSVKHRHLWRYVTTEPAADWMDETFDDSAWQEGMGGFGTEGTPGARIGSVWDGDAVWLRRTFHLDEVPDDLELFVHHDEDAEIYVNGVLVARPRGYTTDYVPIPLKGDSIHFVRPGENVLAVHCRNTAGGQYIDVGFVTVEWSDDP